MKKTPEKQTTAAADDVVDLVTARLTKKKEDDDRLLEILEEVEEEVAKHKEEEEEQQEQQQEEREDEKKAASLEEEVQQTRLKENLKQRQNIDYVTEVGQRPDQMYQQGNNELGALYSRIDAAQEQLDNVYQQLQGPLSDAQREEQRDTLRNLQETLRQDVYRARDQGADGAVQSASELADSLKDMYRRI